MLSLIILLIFIFLYSVLKEIKKTNSDEIYGDITEINTSKDNLAEIDKNNAEIKEEA